MAAPGQLKTKIDLLKKKIAEKGSALSRERRCQLRKRLKRMQRARRTALVMEARVKAKTKTPAPATAEAQSGGEASPPSA
jgi:hypothetical protein